MSYLLESGLNRGRRVPGRCTVRAGFSAAAGRLCAPSGIKKVRRFVDFPQPNSTRSRISVWPAARRGNASPSR